MEIMDTEKMLQIQNDALNFTRLVISVDGNENWNTIYELKRDLLMKEESHKAMKNDLCKQLARSESRYLNEIQELKLQVEQLKKQIK